MTWVEPKIMDVEIHCQVEIGRRSVTNTIIHLKSPCNLHRSCAVML